MPIIEMKNITKVYPGVKANDSVNLTIEAGTIHAIVGENGAGKTTLMGILYGLRKATSGSIFLRGEKVDFQNANDAIVAGLGMVHQHFMLIPTFTVAENVILGAETGKWYKLDRKQACKAVEELCEVYQFHVNPRDKIENLSVATQQRVEIIKALYRGSEILILDEPTAVLTDKEIEELGEVILKLKELGKTIILITHKLDEVLTYSDNITVLRNGKNAGELITKNTTKEEISLQMIGREVIFDVLNRKEISEKPPILEIKDLKYKDNSGIEKLKGITLTVNKGEILGIAGVDGGGQQELITCINGILKPTSGEITIDGESVIDKSVLDIKRVGLGFVPTDRHKEGLVLDFTIEENTYLGFQDEPEFQTKLKLIRFDKTKALAKKLIKSFNIKAPSEETTALELSGGNQQKLILAREIHDNVKVIVSSQATRGLDVGAIEFVHTALNRLRNDGIGVMYVSFELDELLILCDRIAVMFDGHITGVLERKDFSREKIGILMTGKRDDQS